METARTVSGPALGTLDYMSPEQSLGARPDHRSDIFSLGVVIYEMLAARHPFRRETPIGTLQAIRSADPLPLEVDLPGLTPALERIVMRCLEKEPADRFQSARDLAHALLATMPIHDETATRAGGLLSARAVVGFAVASAVALVLWSGARRSDVPPVPRTSAAATPHSASALSGPALPLPPFP